jgi:O-antigen/teichoic acid export membrane protein
MLTDDMVPLVGAETDGLTVGSTPPAQGDESPARRTATSAKNLAGQFGALTILSVANTIAITRLLGPTGYGIYGSAIAASAVLGATADFGFTTMLSRDMATETANHRALLRAAYQVAIVWSGVLALVMVALALTAPITSTRGLALLVLAPAMAFNGFNPASAVFLVTYETKRLVRINVVTVLGQSIVAVALAAAHFGPVAVAATVSLSSIVNSVWIAVVAQRMLPASDARVSRRALIRGSAPLGALSIMTRVYGMIDLVLLGWYISGPRLGDYAAASKIFTVLAALAGTVMTGSLPALASLASQREDISYLSARIWHWLLVTAIPLFLGLGLFAPLAIDITLGSKYHAAVTLTRIIALAGVISVLTNLVGNIQVAVRRMRALYVQSSAAIILNVIANLILIPHYGVYAAAWVTAATEALVCTAGIVSLRNDLRLRALLRVTYRPGVAAALAAAAALPLLANQVVAMGVALVVFLAATTFLRCWPDEFRVRRLVSS